MGIFKLLAISAIGFGSARAIGRINAQVSRIAVPQLSSLAQQAEAHGDFYADTFIIAIPQRIAYSNIVLPISDVTKSFFTCKVFSACEKPLLKLTLGFKEPLFDKAQFFLGDKIFVWTTVFRTQDEILLHWSWKSLQGFTWLHVSADQRYLMLGSSIGHKESIAARLNCDYSPSKAVLLSYYQLRDNPYEENIFYRLKTALIQLCGAAVLSIHQFYSRLLLLSTLKTLVLEDLR